MARYTRRLILRDANGSILHDRILNLTGIEHANSQMLITAEIQQYCDLQQWHTISSWKIPPWGRAESANGS